MHRLAITFASLALLAAVVSAEIQRGNETISEDKRPKLNNSGSAASDKKKRTFQMQDDGITFRLETENGKRMDIAIAYFCELQEDGTQVGGPDGLFRLDEGSEERDKLKIDPPNDVDRANFGPDTIDPEGRLPRRGEEGGQQTTPDQPPPPRDMTTQPPEPETTAPPPQPLRRRRAVPSQRPSEDGTQTLESDDIAKQSMETSYDLDKTGEGSGARLQFKNIAMLMEGEGNFTVGSETQRVKSGDLKLQLIITDFTFCGGDGGRDCNGTVGKVLKACFEHKGSSGASDNPQAEENTEDDTKKFRASEGSVKYSTRYISDDKVYSMNDEDVAAETKDFDNSNKHCVCVKFYRPEVGAIGSYLYDPTGSTDDDDDEADDATTQSSAAHLSFAMIGWVLVAVLKIVL